MEKRREDLVTCPSCRVLNSPENFECFACGHALKEYAAFLNLAQSCEYFNEVSNSCGVSDCFQGCCLLCADVRTCLTRCFQAERRLIGR